MPGLYGYIKANGRDAQISRMADAMTPGPALIYDAVLSDENIEAGRCHIGQIGPKTSPARQGDVAVWVEGEVYNDLDAPLDQAILKAYQAGNLQEFLHDLNGPYGAVIYDAKARKILLITERLGLRPLFYYLKEGCFAWAGEVKALLELDFADKSIDPTSPGCFMDIGYLLEDHTWFEHIKAPPPASILTFDLDKKTLSRGYYFKWSEVRQQDIGFETAVDKAYELTMQAIARCIKPGERIGIGLSGGLDSRLLLAAAHRLHPDMKGYAFTFGTPESEDVSIARRVLKLVPGWTYDLFPFTPQNWFSPRKEQIWRTDGMLNMLHMHGAEFLPDMKKHADIFLNGYAGDTMLGGGFLTKDNLDKRIDQENAKAFYGSRVDMTKLDDPFYDIPHSEPHIYANRCRRFTHLGAVNAYSILDIRMPFLDLDLMEFIYSIPDHYRKGNKLYAAMLLKYFPDYYKDIPWQKTGRTIDQKSPNKLMKRIKGKIVRTLATYGIGSNKGEFTHYGAWIREPDIAAALSELLRYEGSEYAKYLDEDLKKKYLDPHLAQKYIDNNDRILRAATMELYLRRVFRDAGESHERERIPQTAHR